MTQHVQIEVQGTHTLAGFLLILSKVALPTTVETLQLGKIPPFLQRLQVGTISTICSPLGGIRSERCACRVRERIVVGDNSNKTPLGVVDFRPGPNFC